MKPAFRIATVALLAAILAGCVPKKIVWSPDGQQAAVVANRQLYLCDADGNLSAPIADGVEDDTLSPVAWFPDSQRVLVVLKERVRQWQQIGGVLSDSVRNEIVTRAEQLRDDLAAYEGDWAQFESRALSGLSGEQNGAIRIYLRDHLAKGLEEHLSEGWWNSIQRASVEIRSLQIVNVDVNRKVAEARIARTIDGILEIRISPDGKKVAYVSAARELRDDGRLPDEATDAPTLFVVSADGNSEPQTVANYVAWFPDWSADSRHLVYAQPSSPPATQDEDLVLGTISRRQVSGDDGTLLEAPGGTEALAGIIFNPVTKIRSLHDGRILFSAAEVHLPATGGDMPERASLFVVDPGRQATVTRAMPRQSEMHPVVEGLPIGLFETSPDGTRVAIAHEDGRVAIFNLDGGDIRLVQADNEKDNDKSPELRTMPTWRSNDELCFIVPPGSEYGSTHRAEVVLLSANDERHVLSNNWPAAVVNDLLGAADDPQAADTLD